jgi:hypothetical protein
MIYLTYYIKADAYLAGNFTNVPSTSMQKKKPLPSSIFLTQIHFFMGKFLPPGSEWTFEINMDDL